LFENKHKRDRGREIKKYVIEIKIKSFIFQPSLSTEELNAEMKNLEGLMRDLSSISHHANAAATIPNYK